jgi:hypothetical protein
VEIVNSLYYDLFRTEAYLSTAQERAVLRPEGFPGGEMLLKTQEGNTTTLTPHVEFAPDLIKMLANVAGLINTEVFLVR